MNAADKVLNCRGLNCPLPVLKTKKTLNGMNSGQVLQVVATDPGSVKDMAAFSRLTGNEMLQQVQDGADFVFFIQKRVEA